MAKAVRFPRKIEFWVPDAIADGLDALAADGMLTISDHARQALALYLRTYGVAVAPRPAQSINGQHKETARAL
jgi:hypothetical protein